MARFDFCGPDYQSASPLQDNQVLRNWYLEVDESGEGTSAKAIFTRPGLQIAYQVQGKQLRGQIEINGLYGFVVDSNLYQGLADGTTKLLNPKLPLANDGLPVSLATSNPTTGTPGQLLLASGGTAYVFDYAAQTLTAVPPTAFSSSGLAKVSQVEYCDGFFIALIQNSNFWFVTQALNAAVWIGSFGESVFPENITGMLVDHRELWIWSNKRRIVHYVSGNPLFPFDVVSGSFDENGLAATFGAARLDNSLFWIGQDERGARMAWRAEGYKGSRITNHSEENLWQSFGRVDDAVSYACQINGHTWWVIYFPSADRTRVYDAATNTWAEWTFLDDTNQPPTEHAHRSWNHQFAFGKHLVGDPQSGAIYQMALPIWNADQTAWLFADDFGNLIRRARRSPYVSRERALSSHSEIEFILSTGIGPVPSFPGNEPAVTFNLQDSKGAIWKFGVDDTGRIITTPSNLGGVQPWIFNDPKNLASSWQLQVTPITGVPYFTGVPYTPLGRIAFQMVSLSGSQKFVLACSSISGAGQYTTTPAGPVTRGPQMLLRWSDDGNRTWSNEHWLDCGRSGETTKRVRHQRLGQSRSRSYEVVCTDPVNWSIIDALLDVDGEPRSERIIQQARKRA